MKELDLKAVTTSPKCTGASFSFVPYGTIPPTLMDHVIVDELIEPDIKKCQIISEAPHNLSRHLPITFTLSVHTLKETVSQNRSAK